MATALEKRQFWTARDLQHWPERRRARTINSLSGFKSATLVGTSDLQGHLNLSMVSSVVHLGSTPALMGMVLRPPAANSHTYANLIETQQCTFSQVNAAIYEQAHQCSARYPRETSEFDAVGLTPWTPPDLEWLSPAVEESHVRMGFTLEEEFVLPNDCRFMVCRLRWVDVPANAVAPDGYVAIGETGAVTVSGLDGYHRTHALGRLSYAKADRKLEHLTDMLQGWED